MGSSVIWSQTLFISLSSIFLQLPLFWSLSPISWNKTNLCSFCYFWGFRNKNEFVEAEVSCTGTKPLRVFRKLLTAAGCCNKSFLQHFCRDIESRLTWGGGVVTEAYKSHSSSIMSEKNVLPEAKRSLHLTRPLLSTLLCILLASWLP